jgi:hypothetical protein
MTFDPEKVTRYKIGYVGENEIAFVAAEDGVAVRGDDYDALLALYREATKDFTEDEIRSLTVGAISQMSEWHARAALLRAMAMMERTLTASEKAIKQLEDIEAIAKYWKDEALALSVELEKYRDPRPLLPQWETHKPTPMDTFVAPKKGRS